MESWVSSVSTEWNVKSDDLDTLRGSALGGRVPLGSAGRAETSSNDISIDELGTPEDFPLDDGPATCFLFLFE
jgi:hypothetical protein